MWSRRSTHSYSRSLSDTNEVAIVDLVYFGGINHLSGFDNKVPGNPATKQLVRNRTQHYRWQLKFVTLLIHVSQLDTCTLKLFHLVDTSSPPYLKRTLIP